MMTRARFYRLIRIGGVNSETNQPTGEENDSSIPTAFYTSEEPKPINNAIVYPVIGDLNNTASLVYLERDEKNEPLLNQQPQ